MVTVCAVATHRVHRLFPMMPDRCTMKQRPQDAGGGGLVVPCAGKLDFVNAPTIKRTPRSARFAHSLCESVMQGPAIVTGDPTHSLSCREGSLSAHQANLRTLSGPLSVDGECVSCDSPCSPSLRCDSTHMCCLLSLRSLLDPHKVGQTLHGRPLYQVERAGR